MKNLKNLIYLFLFLAAFPSGIILCSHRQNNNFIHHKDKEYGPFCRHRKSPVFVAMQDNNPSLPQEEKKKITQNAIGAALRDRCKMALLIKFKENGIVAITKYYNPDFK